MELLDIIKSLIPDNNDIITEHDYETSVILATERYKTDRGDVLHIPLKDIEAVANWGVALLLDKLANNYAGSHSSTISSDSVDHGSKSNFFNERARICRQLYYDHLGIDPKRTIAHGVVVESKRRPTLTRGLRSW